MKPKKPPGREGEKSLGYYHSLWNHFVSRIFFFSLTAKISSDTKVKKLEHPDILKVWKYAMHFFWSSAFDTTFVGFLATGIFPLYTLINKSAAHGCVRVKPFPSVSTYRFLMLLFAGGGLWKMGLVATSVVTTSGARYFTEFTEVKCSGVAHVR